MVKRLQNAKIACLDFSLQKTKMKLGVQVLINDPEKLDQIRQRCVCACVRAFPFELLPHWSCVCSYTRGINQSRPKALFTDTYTLLCFCCLWIVHTHSIPLECCVCLLCSVLMFEHFCISESRTSLRSASRRSCRRGRPSS